MTSISGWGLSIVGVCFISIFVDLCMPSGKMNASIRQVLSYVVIFVVILPLPGLFSSNFSSESVFSEIEITIQDDYIHNLNNYKLIALQDGIQEDLKKNGIAGAEVSISAAVFTSAMQKGKRSFLQPPLSTRKTWQNVFRGLLSLAKKRQTASKLLKISRQEKSRV